MRKLYAIICFGWLCTAATQRATAQNLVLNPSFETVNTGSLKCSWYLDNSEFTPAISNWDMPTGGSTDIFHTSLATSCFCSPYSTDPSAVGSQTPRTGSSMTALFTYGSGGCAPYREYVQGQLSSSLVVGTTYRIEMYVSLADYSNRAANNIGVKFLNSRYSSTSMCVWSAVPDVNYTGAPITDKTNWTRISFCFTPSVPNLQYFAIGNFYNDGSTTTTALSGAQSTVRYYLDDVSIAVSGGAATASASGLITCINNSVNLSTNISGASYTWVAPSGSSITSGVNSQSATGQGGGTYTVNINDPNSCGSPLSSAVVNVPMNTTPPPASAASGGALTCATTNVTLSGSSSGGMNYSWSGPGIVSGGSTANPVVNQPGTYNLTVTNPSNGCTANTNVSVSQNTTPPGASASASSAITCTATSISLSGTSTSGVSYSWSGPGIVSGGNTANPVVNQAGSYNLTVTGSNGCTSSAAVNVTQNTSLPNAAASSGSTVTCTSSAVSLSASPAGLTYTWSASAGSSITGGLNAQAATANGPGPYTVFVYNPSNGCSATVNVSPVINNAPPAATASAGSGVLTCTTGSLTLSVSPSGMNYSWSGPGIVSGGSTANPVVNQPGTYNLTITNPSNGCSANASTTVSQNTVQPTASIGPSSYTTTCTSPTVQLTATSSAATANYSWQVPSTGSLNNSSVSNPVASGTGVFTVVVTNTANGCISTAAVSQVFADAAVPSVSLSTGSLVLTCATTTLGVTATATGNNLSYNWSPSPLSGGNTANPVFGTPGTYAVVVTNTVNGCSTGANVSVTTNTTSPSVGAIPTQTLTCATNMAALTATSSVASSSYSWTGPGIIGTANTTTVIVNQAGTYSVVITNNLNGCSSTATGSVISNIAPPSATLSAVSSNSTISCILSSVTLSVVSTPTSNVSYSWSIGGNTPSAGIANPGVVTVTVTNMLNGCETTAQFLVTGNVIAPPVVAGSATMPCTSTTVALLASSSTGGVTYAWSGPLATSIISGAYTASPVCSSVGIYTVVVTDQVTSCSTTATVSVVHGSVTAAFDADPTSGISPLSVNFTNQSTGAVAYSWNFGNGNTSSAINPSQVFTGSQTFTVMLVATAGPCKDTAYATIVVDDDLTIEIPNVFTPNGDGTNDVFYIKSTGVKDMELEIFNRWGQKLYTFAGSKASWDGMSGQGQVVPDGTYFFFVRVTGFNGKAIEKQGSLTLLR